MKNYTIKIAILTMIALSTSFITLFADISSEYKSVDISVESYRELKGGITNHSADKFFDYVNQQKTSTINDDDGYTEVNLPFNFGFRGRSYNKIWISVNGFITFDPPKSLPQNDAEGLFTDANTTFQTNVVAPYWGNHHYRTALDGAAYTVSSINTKHEDAGVLGEEAFVVEWKDLNINEDLNPANSNPTSVASFQVRLYKTSDSTLNSLQGDIEFAYGIIGAGSNAEIEGAAIGIKGNNNFINGLHHAVYDDITNDILNPSWYALRTSENTKTSFWQPSGASENRIRFRAEAIVVFLQFWGDGDTDLSQSKAGRHYQMKQRRFVNFADVRDIMKNMAKNIPLDSVRGQAAFHADVNHDGRFALRDTNLWLRGPDGRFMWYHPTSGNLEPIPTVEDSLWDDPTDNPDMGLQFIKFNMYDDLGTYILDNESVTIRVDSVLKQPIKIRAYYWNDPDSIPSNVTDYSDIFFYADEYDAAMIVEYLGAKIPALPWVWDTVNHYGKVTTLDRIASDVTFGELIENKDGQLKLPVYLNGDLNGALSIKFNFDSFIDGIEIVENDDNLLMADYDKKTAVIAGTVNYTSELPIAYIYVNSNKNLLNVSNVYFNSNKKSNRNLNIEAEVSENNDMKAISFKHEVDIKFNATEDGIYTMVVFDMMGNVIKTVNEFKAVGNNSFNWNATNNDNIEISKGMYVYSINGVDTSVSGKLIYE